MLNMVTLSGADQSVEPTALLGYSREYPFVEWGILADGEDPRPRYPGLQWITDLNEQAKAYESPTKPHFSLHINGAPLLGAISNGDFDWPFVDDVFERVQLNFHGEKVPEEKAVNLVNALSHSIFKDKEVIIQLDGVNDQLLVHLNQLAACALGPLAGRKFSGLFDQSSGQGIKPSVWPMPIPNTKCGYAGGLTARNVVGCVDHIRISCYSQDFWIDMETGLRQIDRQGSDCFDLGLCRNILDDIARTNAHLLRDMARTMEKLMETNPQQKPPFSR